MDVGFEIPLGLPRWTHRVFSLPNANIYAERTCNFKKVVVRKVERKFEFTSLRHRVYLLQNLLFASRQ
jgi:hypothetical protein